MTTILTRHSIANAAAIDTLVSAFASASPRLDRFRDDDGFEMCWLHLETEDLVLCLEGEIDRLPGVPECSVYLELDETSRTAISHLELAEGEIFYLATQLVYGHFDAICAQYDSSVEDEQRMQ